MKREKIEKEKSMQISKKENVKRTKIRKTEKELSEKVGEKIREDDEEVKEEAKETEEYGKKSEEKVKKVEKRKEKGERKKTGKRETEKEIVERLIVELYNQGNSPEKIGMILRDTYGIGNVKEVCGKKIIKILSQHGLNVIPPDLEALIEKIKNVKKHFERHKHDYVSKRSLQTLRARIRILTNYYKKKRILPPDFAPRID